MKEQRGGNQPPSLRAIYFTFDTEPAPHRDHTGEILDILRANQAHATFFLQGQWAEENPELAQRIVGEGHAVGNHTYSHVLPSQVTSEVLRAEILRAQEAIITACGVSPRPLFRCPQNSGAHEHRVLTVADELGYRQVGWDIDSLDWVDYGKRGDTAQDIAAVVTRALHGSAGDDVILMHSWPDVTPEALRCVFETIDRMSVRFLAL